MAQGPAAGLALLAELDHRLGDHHRLHFVRAHLLELDGQTRSAVAEYQAAAARTDNLREKHYLTTKTAQLATRAASSRVRFRSWERPGTPTGRGRPWRCD